MMNPPLESEAAFNAWYDDEHVPNRVGLDGFLSAKRFAAAEPAGPRYLATYELESLDVLAGEPYRNVVAERSARERDMLARIPLIDRRVYEPVLDGEPWTAEPPYVLLVAMTPRVGGEDDFVSWYREEHIRLLLAVRGWRRVRLFRQLEGDGPAFLAVHELESPNVFDEPAYQAAISTPWRGRIRSSVTRYERNLFKLRRSFL
ncbi:MAG TPA: hypothetical protein VGQ62_24865 [Chloroflexota bacterium]|nr:hypothetical protein [Chloroflexota bacterium]